MLNSEKNYNSFLGRLESEASQQARTSAFINHILLYCEDNKVSSEHVTFEPVQDELNITLNTNFIPPKNVKAIEDMAQSFHDGKLFGWEWLMEEGLLDI